ncbi:MAG TPA: hypothetical protein VJX16_08865 [Terriglobales bacterium]|nr:hypothetical protein [Terriglobales bacterium]
MKTSGPVLLLFLVVFMVPLSPASQKKHRSMTGSAATGAVSAGMHVAPDLDQRLAKWREVHMQFHSVGLKPQEIRMVEKLVDACRHLEEIYWRQSDPQGLSLYQTLQTSANPKDVKVRRLLRINGSRFDLLDEHKPFLGTDPMPPGHGLYPQGLTRERIEQYVKEHPEKKAEIYSPTTVVRWHRDQLEGLPYHNAYRSYLEPAARDLREAAVLSTDSAFANFLRLRAEALLSDDYFNSDLAWVDLKDPKFDIIFAPYETYLDDVLGVKGSYGAAVLIRNPEESKKLAMFQKYVPDIQDSLPLAPEDRPSKKGQVTPMEVMDAPFRAGDLLHGYQAVADNLPNDPRIHEQKGTKKIFFKNFMDARVNYIILPVAQRIMRKDQAAKATAEGYLLATIMHEISHGIGPAYARTPAGKVDIRQAIGPAYSGLEEAKADAVGMFGLKWLVGQGALPKNQLEGYYASYVAGIFRTVRFGTGEAHGQAEMMEFNYLSERGAIKREPTGRYTIDYAAMPGIINDLAKEILEIEATGDRARAEKWFAKYDTMPEELKISLKLATDVPVDIDPRFSFKERF